MIDTLDSHWKDVRWTRSIGPLREGHSEMNMAMHLWVNNELRYTGYCSQGPYIDIRRKVAVYAIKTSNPAFARDPFYFACYNPDTVSRCRMLAILLSGCLDGSWRKLPIELVHFLLEELIIHLEFDIWQYRVVPSAPVVRPGWRVCGELKYM